MRRKAIFAPIERIKELADSGMTTSEIAETIGCTTKTIINKARLSNIKINGYRRSATRKNSAPIIEISISVRKTTWDGIEQAAKERGHSKSRLVDMVMSAVVADNLIDAVIDESQS